MMLSGSSLILPICRWRRGKSTFGPVACRPATDIGEDHDRPAAQPGRRRRAVLPLQPRRLGPAGARWLHISGQVGATPDGTIPDDAERQFELAWDNLFAVLADAGMAVTDLVKVDGFITRPDLVPLYRTVRERRLGGYATASTLVVVAGLAVPSLLVEIQAVAAR